MRGNAEATEKYTHVTHLAKMEIISPIDNFDVKDNKTEEKK
jgi:hypothetical protein